MINFGLSSEPNRSSSEMKFLDHKWRKKLTSSNAPTGLLQGPQGLGSPQDWGGFLKVVDWFYFQRSPLVVFLTLNYFCELQLQSGLHWKAF